MNYIICTIYDEKTCLFGNLMLFSTEEEAIRYFSFLVNEDKNRLICKDLVLYTVGMFDNKSGCVKADLIPLKVKHATEVLESCGRGD